tara:strand:+ start:1039 stop:1749 length:711 start_codon:yes stop_codon:yes gene_type:complete
MRLITDDTNPPRRRRRRRLTSTGVPIADKVFETPMSEREKQEMALSLAAANQMNRLTDPMTQQPLSEDHPLAKEYIEDNLFASVGYDGDSSEDAWSAATVSNLAKAFDPTFEGSARHSDYIRRGFQNEGPVGYKSEKAKRRTDYQVGDILFKGRKDEDGNPIGPQTFSQFEKDAEGKGKYGDKGGYGSHSDIITGTGVDEKGKYYEVQGGNIGDKLMTKRLYAKELAKRYAGRLTQ